MDPAKLKKRRGTINSFDSNSIGNEAEYLTNIIAAHNFMLFLKSDCPYSIKLKNLLDFRNVPYSVIYLDNHVNGTRLQKKLTEWTKREAPFVYVMQSFVGGFDEVSGYISAGVLHDVIKGVDMMKFDFDLVVIGGGTAGLAAAKGAAKYGKRVAICDSVKPTFHGTTWGLGGSPAGSGSDSKDIFYRASVLRHDFKDSSFFGWELEKPTSFNWEKLAKLLEEHLKMVSWGHRKNLREIGVEYINGWARFKNNHSIIVVDPENHVREIAARSFIIATGSTHRPLEIRGEEELTLSIDDLLSLQTFTGKRALVIGSGKDGLEIAGILSGLGIETSLVVRRKILPLVDSNITEQLKIVLEAQGVRLITNTTIVSFEKVENIVRVKGKRIDDNIKSTTVDFSHRKLNELGSRKSPPPQLAESESINKESSNVIGKTVPKRLDDKTGTEQPSKDLKQTSNDNALPKNDTEQKGQAGHLKQDPGHVKQDSPKQEPGQVKQDSGQLKQEPGQVKQDSGQLKQDPGQVKQDSGQLKQNPGQVKQDSGQLKQDPGQVKQDSGQLKQEPGQVKQDSGQLKQEPGQVKQDSGQLKQEPGQVKQDSGQLKQEPGQVKQDSGQLKQNPGQVKQDSGQLKQESGQVKQEPGQLKQQSSQLKQESENNYSEEFLEDFDVVVVAAGRKPNVADMGLQNLEIKLCPKTCKIIVNEFDQTNIENIFAVGQVANALNADIEGVAKKAAQLIARNMFESNNSKMKYRHVPTLIMTPIPYAYIGDTEESAKIAHGKVEVYHDMYSTAWSSLSNRFDRRSYVKVICAPRVPMVGCQVVGIHVMAPNAGDILQGFVAAFNKTLTKEDLDDMVGLPSTTSNIFSNLTITKSSGKDIGLDVI